MNANTLLVSTLTRANGEPVTNDEKTHDIDEMLACLRAVMVPDAVYEIRGLYPSRSFRVTAEDLDGQRQALQQCAACQSIYATLNPLLPDTNGAAKDESISRRSTILVDVDPKRAGTISSTEEEYREASAATDRIMDFLSANGFPTPIRLMTGNGEALLVAVDLPNDAEAESLVKRFLKRLAIEFDTDRVKIDQCVANASRIFKLAGSMARKGLDTPKRPHRQSRMLSWPDRVEVVPTERLEAIAVPEEPVIRIHRPESAVPQRPTHGSRPSNLERASAYLAKIDAAIEGQEGSKPTFRAACVVGPGFDLDYDAAFYLLKTEYSPRCVPPWSDAQLHHKLEDAYAKETRPRGWKLDDDRPDWNPPARSMVRETAKPPDVDQLDSEPRRLVGDAPDDPVRLADLFLDGMVDDRGNPTLLRHKGEWIRHDGAAWRPFDDGAVKARLHPVINRELVMANALMEKGKPFKTSRSLVADVLMAAEAERFLDADVEQPSWLGEDRPFPAREILATQGSIVHLPTYIRDGSGIMPSTPRFFNGSALDFAFNPDAPEPVGWLGFLESCFPGDEESVRTLQEWAGYCLTADATQQKILLLIGKTRSGKGTYARVLSRLIGLANTCYPTLAQLATNFGLQTWIGKSLAVISDARLSGRTDQAAIVERLLSISGEDDQTIDRKHKAAWNGRLSTRIMILSNEVPRLSDASLALAGRMVAVKFDQSFKGREDKTLSERLYEELPSILLWAIAGRHRLTQQGRFTQPKSGGDLIELLSDLSSPMSAFLEDRCEIGPGREIEAGELFAAWESWCEENGRDKHGNTASFSANLSAATGIGKAEQRRDRDQIRRRYFHGICLRDD